MYNKSTNKFNKTALCLIGIILLLGSFLFTSISVVNAATNASKYSDVLVDLLTDENFDPLAYPQDTEDYTLQVIQIAESNESDLFIYTYQPSGSSQDFRASSINISTTIGNNFMPVNYRLEYLNSNGVFYKYRVVDFEILPDKLRYYSIISIYRPWIEGIDEPASEGQTISEVPFEVGKLYTATTVNGVVSYTCQATETIEVVTKSIGFIRYENGFTLYHQACDSHYVAFSTNKPMDKLMEATVYFWYQDVQYTINLTGTHRHWESEPYYKTINLSDIETGSNSAHGWFATQYEWQRIESVNEFKASLEEDEIELTDEALNALNDKQWVLRFYESDYQLINSNVSWENVQEVNDVTILRLKFETDGITYNLGVVDNKQSGDIEPDNKQPTLWDKVWNYLWKILTGLLIIVAVIVGLPWLVFLLFKCLAYIFKDKSKTKKKKGGG